jgi:hypothetical protein
MEYKKQLKKLKKAFASYPSKPQPPTLPKDSKSDAVCICRDSKGVVDFVGMNLERYECVVQKIVGSLRVFKYLQNQTQQRIIAYHLYAIELC